MIEKERCLRLGSSGASWPHGIEPRELLFIHLPDGVCSLPC